MSDWAGIRASELYAVYRVSEQVYSDEAFPSGEYAIVFLVEYEDQVLTAHVSEGRIVRLDTIFSGPSQIDLDRMASEIILSPKKLSPIRRKKTNSTV